MGDTADERTVVVSDNLEASDCVLLDEVHTDMARAAERLGRLEKRLKTTLRDVA